MLYIHIGLQKTGTTALQLALARSCQLVYEFDKPKRVFNELGATLYSSGNQNFFVKCKQNKFSEKDIKLLHSGGFISSENFTNLVSGTTALKNLLTALKNDDVPYEILITIRNVDEYIESLYAELTTNSLMCEMRSFQHFYEKIKSEFNKLLVILESEPKKIFHYSPRINEEILIYIGARNYNNLVQQKNSKLNNKLSIGEYEVIAKRNRYLGFSKIYRYKLRNKFKGDNLKASHFYIVFTYLRALLRLIMWNK